MDLNIQTSTPIICEKLLPAPPRKLWATDSVTEQLYRNKWTKYRNSVRGPDSWSDLEAPRFIDFADIPDARDSYFDNADEEKFATPQRIVARQLPGLDSENNNILASFEKCSLSAIKKTENENHILFTPSSIAVSLTGDSSGTFEEPADSTIKPNDQDKMDIVKPEPPYYKDASIINAEENSFSSTRAAQDKMDIVKPEPPDYKDASIINAEENSFSSTRAEGKNRSDNSDNKCTTVKPFSFESREKCKQAHRKARRERDSFGKKTWEGFRASPVPNFLKLREKKGLPGTKKRAEEKKERINNVDRKKLNNAAEIWKRKAFEPSHPTRAPIAIKAPHLFTAARARERQRFEEMMREKERQREEAKKIEEAARKKREEEEIAKLRRELVHKAQPIRKYKLIIPRVEKRPLTEPTTPITCKRRRKT